MTQERYNKILVTGSNGFVGEALCEALRLSGYDVLGSVRDRSLAIEGQDYIIVDSLDSETDWGQALECCDVVVHLAGRAHMLNDEAADPLEAFRQTNTIGTLNLAEQAAIDGVVCSPHELSLVSKRKSLLSITPGIRLKDSNDDQSRVMTPKDAINLGANFLVIGRPITEAENIKEALLEIHNSL